MHRFFVPPQQCSGQELTLDGREAHHALHVVRVKVGEQVSVLNGTGHEYFCKVMATSRHAITLAVDETKSTPPDDLQVTLIQAIPKGKAWDSILQKATELGAHRIVPLLTERVVIDADASKLEKWEWIAIDSIKQCGNRWLPQIDPPRQLRELLQQPLAVDLTLIASLEPGSEHPRRYLRDKAITRVAIWIGPEGDFTSAETKIIREAGARPITLGPRVLRADTAAVYCLSVLNYECNR